MSKFDHINLIKGFLVASDLAEATKRIYRNSSKAITELMKAYESTVDILKIVSDIEHNLEYKLLVIKAIISGNHDHAIEIFDMDMERAKDYTLISESKEDSIIFRVVPTDSLKENPDAKVQTSLKDKSRTKEGEKEGSQKL